MSDDYAKTTKRKEEVKAQRRRRKDFGVNANLKLHIPESAKDPNKVYRWINDTAEGRMSQKTVYDDYDPVTAKDLRGFVDTNKDAGEGTPIKRVVGKTSAGEPLYAYLCAKPREYYEEDKKQEQARIDAQEAEMKRNVPKHTEGIEQGKAYMPAGGNLIRHSVDQ